MEKPLFWHQGLFLQPQHFQRQERYLTSALQSGYDTLMPHLWGVRVLDMPEMVVGDTLEKPTRAELLFQDGTAVTYPGNAVIASRKFDTSWLEEGRSFHVFIGLKKWNPEGENVTIVENLEQLPPVTSRFVSPADPDLVRDMLQEGPEAQMKFMSFVLKYVAEDEVDQMTDYHLIPAARIERQNDKIILSKQFIPPCISTAASPALSEIITEIRDEMAARCHQLETLKTQRGIHTAEFGAKDMIFLLAMRSLGRYVPLLFHICREERIHPWPVFGVLRQIIGELSTFSESVSFMGEEVTEESRTPLVPPYRHTSLDESFFAAKTMISRLLDDITAGPEYRIQLLFDGTFYAADLAAKMFKGNNRYYLVLKTEADPKPLLSNLETAGKLAAREQLPILIAQALPGVRIDHLTLPPQELPRLANAIYFQIHHHSDHWAEVEKRRNLALYWDAAPEDLEAELMIVGRS